ncbi:antibiotic biosynthesis monooxygenase [Vibrio sp. CDRSL-10 TSBA]
MIAVLFEAQAMPEQQQRYFEVAAQLKPLLQDVEGFISIERFRCTSNPDKFISLSWWQNEQAILDWKQNSAHQQAQHEGKVSIFSHYTIRILTLSREYAWQPQE